MLVAVNKSVKEFDRDRLHRGASKPQSGSMQEGKKLEKAKPSWVGPTACRVEDTGLEPATFWLPARRSPN
jgi:hypothetical protein